MKNKEIKNCLTRSYNQETVTESWSGSLALWTSISGQGILVFKGFLTLLQPEAFKTTVNSLFATCEQETPIYLVESTPGTSFFKVILT